MEEAIFLHIYRYIVTPYKKYHHQHAFSSHYASISPEAELKVRRNDQQSLKIIVFFLLPCLRSLFIHCTTAELTTLTIAVVQLKSIVELWL